MWLSTVFSGTLIFMGEESTSLFPGGENTGSLMVSTENMVGVGRETAASWQNGSIGSLPVLSDANMAGVVAHLLQIYKNG